jgi:hypothetical protein
LGGALGLLFSTIAVWGAVPGDEHWDGQFGAPGVTNNIFAVAVNNGLVYAAGAVPTGARTNTPLNVWDGKQWTVSAVFTGPQINGPVSMEVTDLAFVGNTLYAAGSFTNVNGIAANGLARWDGTSWSGIGFSGIAFALAVDGNNLYVGGIYTNAGGVTTTNIGYWDGSAWHALGDGLGLAGTFTPAVRSIAVKSGTVYAGGGFINSGSQPVTNLAAWNGSTWSGVGGGVNGGLISLAFNGNDLYVGGTFSQAGGIPATNIARWDGIGWSAVGNGLRGTAVESITVFNGSVCAAGIFTNSGTLGMTNFAVWHGTTWSGAGNLNGAGVRAISAGTNLVVGGSFTVAGGLWANQIAAWDGNRWSTYGIPGRLNGVLFSASGLFFSSVSALANDGVTLYAAGSFRYAGTTNANFIARFDGSNWRPLGSGLDNEVVALAVTNNRVYAGGYFTGTADESVAMNHIGCWDGTNWNAMGDPGGVVFALALSTNGLYAAGTGYSGPQFPSPYGSPFFSRWDGTNWYNALNFTNNTFFTWPLNFHDPTGYCALAVQGTNIYLGGNIKGFSQFDPNANDFVTTGCVDIIRFDPNFGWIMGIGLNSYPVALAAVDTNLYAAGDFTIAGGVAANKIARWDGRQWSDVGGGVIGSGTVRSLATRGGDLYAGGTFTNIGGVAANRVARWDGTNWSAFGSGVSSTVFGLTVLGQDLYAAGVMRSAGGKAAFGLAHWNGQQNFNIPQLINPAALPNRQFQVRLMGIGGLTNLIQATTNFISWTPVLTNSAGVYDFADPDSAAFPRRFYRARLGP